MLNNDMFTDGSLSASFAVCTLGCRVNQYESRAIAEALESRGFIIKEFDDICDVYIINTCAVTAESERKSRQMARRAFKRNPDALILMTGCQAQLHPEVCRKLPGVRYVGGNASKLEVADAAVKLLRERSDVMLNTREIDAVFENYSVELPDHTRAYIKIEDGCKNKCAYCVIPKVRGPVRSKPREDVLREARGLVGRGYKEIVLTGIEVCDYQYGLKELIRALADIDGLERIRLASVDPAFIDRAFIDSVRDIPQFCHHFHLSLQSCCDKTLRAMRRPYNTSILKKNIAYARAAFSDIAFTADMICGFPGETDEDFEETLGTFGELGVIYAHIFPFSPRPGTEAADMPEQVSDEVKSLRCERLHALMLSRRREIISEFARTGREFSVLIEEKKNGYWYGHTENFIEVALRSDEELQGCIRKVTLIEEQPGGGAWLARQSCVKM